MQNLANKSSKSIGSVLVALAAVLSTVAVPVIGTVCLGSAVFGAGFVSVAWAADQPVKNTDRHFHIDHRHIKIHVNADGTSVTDQYEVTSLLTETGIDWYGQETVTFSTSRQDLEIVQAYTEQPNGQRFDLQDKAIRLVEADNAQDSGTYSDEKSYVLIFPKLTPGVKTHYRTRRVEHTPLHAGHYFKTFSFPLGIYYGDVTIDLSHDPAIDLRIEVAEREPAVRFERLSDGTDGTIHYRFRYANHEPIDVDSAAVSTMDTAPYVRISSLSSMLEEAKLYQAAVTEKEKPSDHIRKLADEITVGITDPKEQARAIYNWVATEVRYVGIYLGNGGIIPNDADDVLHNRYGDCKDHSTLLVAMLAAKGIEAESAMINSGTTYTLPKLGAISPMNHVITYLPQWDLYVDSTDGHASFGVLSYDISDKPTVLAQSERYHRTPKSSSARNRTTSTIKMTITPDGTITGSSNIEVTGSASPSFRSYLAGYRGAGKDDLPTSQLSRFGLVGKGTYDFEPMTNLDNPVAFKTTFTVDPVTHFPGPGAMWIPVGLAPGRIERFRRETPMAPQAHPYVCQSYAFEERYELNFPATVKISHLPETVEFSERGHTYRATYQLDGNVVSLTRLFEIETPSDVCNPGDEAVYNRFLAAVQDDLRRQIIYEPNSPGAQGSASQGKQP